MTAHINQSRLQSRTSSWSTDQKCLPAYYPTHRRTAAQSIRRGLCRVFGLKLEQSHTNYSDDSIAAASDVSYEEAEMLEEENMAWGSPPRKSRTKRDKERQDRNPGRSPHTPPNVKFEAEMLDEDNMAWGQPSLRKTQRSSTRNQPNPAQKRSSVGPERAGWFC